jgi:D-alanyl-D-alanine carboxypeptidase
LSLGEFVVVWLRFEPVRLLAVVAFLLVGIGAPTSGQSRGFPPKYASIVVDAETGDVLSEYNADAVTYPASLTKMMTLYLTFDAVERKQLTLDQTLPVSAHAAAQEPTKLDLEANDTVTVHDLILGIITQSANDAAVVLAEGLAGSESAFADRMTLTAHAMGMESTNFHNASGLPDPLQRTTARDIAMLARHLYLDFPRQYAYFATEDFTFRGATFSNHNHLMNSFEGMDGIKTGFIRASGFNLAASAVRDGRRLIGVVMGGQSAHARDLKMASLLNAGFDGRVSPDVQLAESGKPGVTKVAAAATLHRLAHHAVHTLANLSPISRAEAAPAHRADDRWSIQVGAFKQQEAALRANTTARSHLPGEPGESMVIASPHGSKHPTYQARIVNLSEKEAQDACRVLRHEHRPCVVISPSVQMAAAHGVVKTVAE